ncbi:DUF4159 domain-containing protein [Phycisphaera mikurensis]|uniref:DUF4159 domain-containing protein n=1 Tax=Phycisphaera mikurensis (strain NBRC 102666 / KCTC 22515 / FYK2301M01) TaxID=1142394 RepID=I0IAG0_PHYMF|nr:DUF4159 domain-containing protein [Phycisphaera mikurensis]MBB6441755.1 hypothetical protein [Phycisphaera mikurensis]BAM02248.1 hypothetical protein PSMK_00890 [Phycisphaera mikurensis NBRC 102666]
MKLVPVLLLALLPGLAAAAAADAAAGDPPPAVAMLAYGGGKSGECFSDRFLAGFNAATDAAVAPAMERVRAADLAAARHPVAILTGEGPFTFREGEAEALRRFVAESGLLIASSGCSDPAWTASLEAALPTLLPGVTLPLPRLPAASPAFRRVFTVETSAYAKGPPRLPELRGAEGPAGRLGFVWSPEGLNDTLGVEGPCCCCGGNEVRAAEALLVNLLAVALDAGPASD